MRSTFSDSTRPRAASERSLTMALTHTQAVVSYCPDLTDPFALSLPVAVFLVGDTSSHRIFVLAALHLPASRAKEFEPFDGLIQGLTRLLPDHVKELEALEGSNVPLERVMSSLAALLRNSLHVSVITPVATANLTLKPDATERDHYQATLNVATELATDTLYAQIDRTHELMQTSAVEPGATQPRSTASDASPAPVVHHTPRFIQRLQDQLSVTPTMTVIPSRKLDDRSSAVPSYAH